MDDLQKKELERSLKIEKQVHQWDLFAKIVPSVFLIASFVFLSLGVINFDALFYIGLALFALTAVIWWFWTIFSIRFLVRVLRRSSAGLIEVTKDLKQAKKELREYINDENNRS